MRVRRNQLVEEDGRLVARPTDDTEDLACGLVFRSVGYHGLPVADLPFDRERGVIPNDAGRVLDPESREPLGGIYAAGWIKRGPSGVISTNKKCARETVAQLFDDYLAGDLGEPSLAIEELEQELPEHVDMHGWRRIDQYEKKAGKEQKRPRVKLVDRSEEHTSELQSLMRISYAVFCLKKKKKNEITN